MMRVVLTDHAKLRALERGISYKTLTHAVRFPDKVETSRLDSKRVLIKKIYHNDQLEKDHLLMIVGEQEQKQFVVVTLIDTSKISKYY